MGGRITMYCIVVYCRMVVLVFCTVTVGKSSTRSGFMNKKRIPRFTFIQLQYAYITYLNLPPPHFSHQTRENSG